MPIASSCSTLVSDIGMVKVHQLRGISLDWNPAADQQALARVWRDGQKKECMSVGLKAASFVLTAFSQASFTASSPRGQSKRRSSNAKLRSKPSRHAWSMKRRIPNDISLWTLCDSSSSSKSRHSATPTTHSSAKDVAMASNTSKPLPCYTVMPARTLFSSFFPMILC